MNPRIVFAAAVSALVLLLGDCAFFYDSFKSCARGLFVDIGLYALHWSALGASIYAGILIARKYRWPAIGWAAGIAIFLASMCLLTYLGFAYPSSGFHE